MINVAGSRLVEQSLDSSDTFIDLLLDRFSIEHPSSSNDYFLYIRTYLTYTFSIPT